MDKFPQMVPPPEPVFIARIRITKSVDSPAKIIEAIAETLGEYARARRGAVIPFAQQPGYPAGVVNDADGNDVGYWEVKEERRA